MKISFPHMGHSYVALKWLVENTGHECIVPPEPSSRTLDLGYVIPQSCLYPV